MHSSDNNMAQQARPIHAYLLLLCGCLSVLAAVVIAPILPKMQAHFADVNQVDFLIPVTLTSPSLVVAILALFVGALADRVGRKKLLIFGLSLYALFGCLPLFLDSLHVIIATRLGVGFTEALIMTCCTALIGDYYRGVQRERYLALNTTFASTSAVIFIAIGGALGEISWRTPFSVYSISLLLAVAAVVMLWEPKRSIAVTTTATSADLGEWTPLRQLGICIATVIGGILFMAVPVHIAYLLQNVGVTASSTVGLIASASQAAVIVGSLLFRLLLNGGFATSVRFGTALLPLAAGYLLIAVGSDATVVTIGALITGVGAGLLLPALLCWNMNNLPDAKRAFGTGAWMSAFFLGQFLTPLVVVGLTKHLDSMPEAFKLLGICIASVAVVLITFRPMLNPRKHEALMQKEK